MSLLARLEAKRREIDREARSTIGQDDYIWWCELRELFDELISPPMIKVPPGFKFGVDELNYSAGYIVERHD